MFWKIKTLTKEEREKRDICNVPHKIRHDGYVPLVVIISRSFPHSWLIIWFITRLTRRVPLLEQELPTLLEHLSSLPVFSGVRVIRSLVLCVCFVNRCMFFCPFSLVLCVLLRFTDSDYPFGIFKLFNNTLCIGPSSISDVSVLYTDNRTDTTSDDKVNITTDKSLEV